VYNSGVKSFQRFCVLAGLVIGQGQLPSPSEQLLENYVCYLAQTNKIGYSSIKVHLCAVRHLYVLNGFGEILANKPRLQLTLRGIRKIHSLPRRNRIPLTADKLHMIGGVIARGLFGPHLDSLLWAAICLGFFGALRCGEFTTKKSDSSEEECLLVGDTAFLKDKKLNKCYLALTLKSSKTDPFRQGCQLLLFATEQFLCPYTSVQKHLFVHHHPNPNTPLLALEDGSPLHRAKFISLLQRAIQVAGLSLEGISGHSLRKGFATTASAANIPDNLIATMGRWASDCYKLYIHTPSSTVFNAQLAIANPELSKHL